MVQCTLPWEQLRVEPGDHLRVCCWSRGTLGNLKEYPTLESVWNGDAIRQFRRDMFEGRHDKICSPVCPYLINGKHASDKFFIPRDNPDHPRYVIRRAFEDGKDTVGVLPIRIEATLDDRCTLRCTMCVWNTGKYRIHPNFFVYVDHAAESLEELELLGGEPFYSKQVIDILKHAKLHQPPYKFAFTTSLSHLPLPLLEHVRIAWMIVSIDGATKATYEAIRIGANWETVMGNLQKLLALRDNAQHRFHVQVNYTVMKKNFREIPAAVRLFSNLRVPVEFHKVNLAPRHPEDVFQQPDLHAEFEKTLRDGLAESRYRETEASLQALLVLTERFCGKPRPVER